MADQWLYVAWLALTHKAEMLGQAVFGIAWCSQHYWVGHGQHPNKNDNDDDGDDDDGDDDDDDNP